MYPILYLSMSLVIAHDSRVLSRANLLVMTLSCSDGYTAVQVIIMLCGRVNLIRLLSFEDIAEKAFNGTHRDSVFGDIRIPYTGT